MLNIPLAQEAATNGGAAVGGLLFTVLYFAVIIFVLAGIWKTLAKAGQPGWAAIIPIYNLIVLLQVAQKPLWWIILFFIPVANIVAILMVMIAIAQNFGKGAGFGLGLAFLGFIFWPILGFGDAQYRGTPAPATAG